MITIERNKSISYFLPIFDKFVPIKYFHLLKNTYFWYDNISEEVFCLLYKFDGKVYGTHKSRRGFTVYEQELRKSKYYLGECDYGEYVIYIFSLTEELLDLRNLLLEGKYSRISDKNKKIIIQYIYNYYSPNDAEAIRQVLYKSKELREKLSESLKVKIKDDAELSSLFTISRELFSNYAINKKPIRYDYKNRENRKEWNPWTNSSTNKRE